MQPGDRVQVLYPDYAAGKMGTILEKEMLQNGSETGYWLVQVDNDDCMILALLPQEMKRLKSA